MGKHDGVRCEGGYTLHTWDINKEHDQDDKQNNGDGLEAFSFCGLFRFPFSLFNLCMLPVATMPW